MELSMKIEVLDFSALKVFVVEPYDAEQSDLRANLMGLGIRSEDIRSYDSMVFLEHVLENPVDLIILNCMHGYFHQKILQTTLNILQTSVPKPIPVLFVLEKEIGFLKTQFLNQSLYSTIQMPLYSKMLYLKINLLVSGGRRETVPAGINEVVMLREDRFALQ